MESNPNYINQEDFQMILDTIPELDIRKWKDVDIQYLFKILYHMALRPSEGIKLEKKDFDLKNRLVYLGKTKTSTSDRATIPKVFVNELAVYLETKEDGRLFPGLNYRTFWVWLKRLGVMLHIDAWQPENRLRMKENTVGHIFRKSWGKDALESLGYEKIDVISTHLRHTKPSMTFDHYLKGNIKKVHDTI
jgi:integrase